jgi:hypothetical protein
MDALPWLSGENPTLEWRLEDPQDALALIEGLQIFQSAGESLRTEWPSGARLRVSRAHGSGELRLRFAGAGDWLQIDGGLALDDGRVIAMRVLLDAANAHGGRYLPLGEGDYLAITSELRDRIDALAALAAPGDAVRLDSVAALALDESVGLKGLEVVMHRGGGGEANKIGNLTHGRRGAVAAQPLGDCLEDARLSVLVVACHRLIRTAVRNLVKGSPPAVV